MTGLSELDFGELSANCKYDGGYSADHPTIKAFWSAVKEMPTEEQKRLLMFATGSKKVCRGRGGCMYQSYFKLSSCVCHLVMS